MWLGTLFALQSAQCLCSEAASMDNQATSHDIHTLCPRLPANTSTLPPTPISPSVHSTVTNLCLISPSLPLPCKCFFLTIPVSQVFFSDIPASSSPVDLAEKLSRQIHEHLGSIWKLIQEVRQES